MPRNPTPAQIEASRANGRKSRGPQGEAKQRSCQNAYKTGLRSKLLALEHESVKYNERLRLWYDYYQPQSPAAFHQASECAHASLLADRCHTYRQAELEKQTAAARNDWRRRREERLRDLAQRVNKDPEGAMAALATFGLGVGWLAACFEELIEEVRTKGYLSDGSLEWCARVFGVTPTPQKIRGTVITYVIRLYNLGCTPGVKPAVIDEWLDPARLPDAFRGTPRADIMPADAADCHDLLLGQLDLELQRLRAEEERLTREVDQPALESVLNRASILTDEAARRVARSHGESRATFHRALAGLYRSLDRDEEKGPPEPASVDDNDAPTDEPATDQAAADEAGKDAPVDVDAGPETLVGVGAVEVPNDPEKPSEAPAQAVVAVTTSVEIPASARVGPEGESSPAAAEAEKPSQGASESEPVALPADAIVAAGRTELSVSALTSVDMPEAARKGAEGCADRPDHMHSEGVERPVAPASEPTAWPDVRMPAGAPLVPG